MSTRTLFYTFAFVVAIVGAISVAKFSPLFLWEPPAPHFIHPNTVRGTEITYKNKPYTLNFEQQNQLMEFINLSLDVGPAQKSINYGNSQKTVFDQITIHRFGQSDIVIKPVVWENDNLVFSVPEWNPDGLIEDNSEGDLKKMLSQTYDSLTKK